MTDEKPAAESAAKIRAERFCGMNLPSEWYRDEHDHDGGEPRCCKFIAKLAAEFDEAHADVIEECVVEVERFCDGVLSKAMVRVIAWQLRALAAKEKR